MVVVVAVAVVVVVVVVVLLLLLLLLLLFLTMHGKSRLACKSRLSMACCPVAEQTVHVCSTFLQ